MAPESSPRSALHISNWASRKELGCSNVRGAPKFFPIRLTMTPKIDWKTDWNTYRKTDRPPAARAANSRAVRSLPALRQPLRRQPYESSRRASRRAGAPFRSIAFRVAYPGTRRRKSCRDPMTRRSEDQMAAARLLASQPHERCERPHLGETADES